MNPTIDYQKIAKEIIDEDGNALTLQRASNWFIKKGYIRGIRPVKYSPFLLKKQPLLTGIVNVDWELTSKPPYQLVFKDRATVGSHFVYIDSPGRIVNSYGPDWGDHGYFYFQQNQVRNMKQMFAIIL